MSVSQAMVRGYNFFVVAFLGIVGGSLVTELLQESEWLFRLDELLIIAIAALAVAWYLVGQHRLTRSPVPMLFAVAALGAKVLGLILEIKDAADVGDDIGIVQMLILFTIVAVVAYFSMRRQTLRLSMQENTQEAGRELQVTS
jgi:hypothetical protein